MQRYFLYLAFDGTNYHGWQIQPNGISVQECINRALSTLFQTPVEVTGAGRTDAGVHASLMVAHFDVGQPLDTVLLADKLNRLLPPDISIYKVCAVLPEAHARFAALSRTYRYYLSTEKYPFLRAFSSRVFTPLDFNLMNEAAKCLLDYTDFTAFSKLHTDVKTNNCRIMHAEWTQSDERTWVFTIKADRFLRNMVRAIVGTLMDVGRHKLTIEGFQKIIEQKNRCKAGSSAPAQGLFLCDIEYPENLFI